MSFKRAADDGELLSVLRQRRIKDLFAEKIPEDEALLMSNGRFACVVCNQKPVFDTVNMLAIHRNGKKHLQSIEYHKQKKEELYLLIEQRRQEQLVKNGTTDLPQMENRKIGILGGIPYDSRVRKHKIKPYERKQRLNLTGSPSKDDTDATKNSSLPGNRSYMTGHKATIQSSNVLHGGNRDAAWSQSKMSDGGKFQCQNSDNNKLSIISKQSEGPVVHPKNLRRIFEKPEDKGTVTAQPYVRREGPRQECAYSGTSVNRVHTGLVYTNSASINTGQPADHLKSFNHHLPLPSGLTVQYTNSGVSSPSNRYGKASDTGGSKHKKKTSCQKEKTDQLPTSEQRQTMEKYRQLRGAGWKKDWDGKWIRDEDAEFDSDEDVPDLP